MHSISPASAMTTERGLPLDDSFKTLRYADVGFNATDPMYRGLYHGRTIHEEDLDSVLARAQAAGCQKFMITGSNLKDSQSAIDIARIYPGVCYATIGIHPCATGNLIHQSLDDDDLIDCLRKMAKETTCGLVVAFGEIGLDYDRLALSGKDTQLKYFKLQLELAAELQLPLFLHSRAAADDFERTILPWLEHLPRRGLVHSFTGTKQELKRLIDLGFDIGVNGCSLKTEESMMVVQEIPLDRLQIETDGPWCEMRPSHASSRLLKDDPKLPDLPQAIKKEKFKRGFMVKGRNEPCTIPRVAYAIARVKGIPVERVCSAAWENTRRMFGMDMSD